MNKIIGGLLLITVALVASAVMIIKERRRLSQLRAFSELIEFIYKQIEAFNLPIAEILSIADPELLRECGFSDKVSDFKGLLSHEGLFIDAKTKSLVFNFVTGLGRSYRDEQLRHCEYYLKEIKGYTELAAAEYPKKCKLILTLSLCAALGLIIIMI